MRTVIFDEPRQWILVDVRGVPEAKREKLHEAFGKLRGAGSRGLLKDGQTLYVTVEATKNTQKKIEEALTRVFREGDLSRAEISFSEGWSLAVTLRPFVSEVSRQRALEARLPGSVKETDWYSGDDEVTLWTESWPSPRLQNEIRSILSS